MKKLILKCVDQLSPKWAHRIMLRLEHNLGIGVDLDLDKNGEALVFTLLERMKKKDLVLFDVGANIGDYTQSLIEHLAGKSSLDIHAFEPSEKTFAKFVEKHAAQMFIYANRCALAAEAGTAMLYTDGDLSGLASLTKRKLDHYGIPHGKMVEEVKLSTLDLYCREKGIAAIDLLKIDVEGHELDVLRGGVGLFEARQVTLVQFEFGGTHIDTRTYLRDYYHFFEPHGYKIFRLMPGNKLLPITKYREIHEKFGFSNFLAASAAACPSLAPFTVKV
jgi:FkbM family methyltransferase